jgi:hypothetical protein
MAALFAQSWNVSAAHVCEWHGVTCNSDCRVSAIVLANMTAPFAGTLPRALSALTGLTHLDVSESGLSGQLDSAFAAWSQLQVLYLSETQLSGSLDAALAAWGQLQDLRAYSTQLSGSLHPAFGEWSQLQELHMDRTLLSGSLDPALANWSRLQHLLLHGTQLSGSLHAALGAWHQLQGLYVDGTQLSGTLDPAFAGWGQLGSLYLYSTQLSGSLDPAFAAWRQLQDLRLYSTQLSGALDPAFAAWSQLRGLYLGNTQLCGTLHPSFAAWSRIVSLYLYGTRLSGSLDPAFAVWRIQYVRVFNTRVEGTIPPAFANWSTLMWMSVSRTRLSGSLPAALSAWRQLRYLHVAETALSGALPADFAAWSGLRTLRAAGTNVSFVAPALFQLSSLHLLDLSRSQVAFDAAAPESCPRGMRADVVDLSGIVQRMSATELLACLLGNGTASGGGGVSWLRLQDARLTGQLLYDSLIDSSVTRLNLDGNLLSADQRFASYSLGQTLDELSVAGNPLSSAFSLDINPIATVNISNTDVSYCYEGAALASADALSLSLRAVRPQPTCSRARERAVAVSAFAACDARPASSSPGDGDDTLHALNGTFCQQPSSRVVFSDTRLTCPSWSTFPSRGAARLDVDAAFLGFWGGACPPDFYWGYADAGGVAEESARLRERPEAELSLGQIERVLQARTCLPCPADLPVRCSALAVINAPHVVTRSVYPFAPQRSLNRSALPYLGRDQLHACLHPAVCGGDSIFIGDNWTQWSALAATGLAFSAPFTQFQCRAGHDASTPLCAGCMARYWLDGFLCRRCFAGAEALVVLGALAGLAALCYVVWRHQRSTARVAADHFLAIILWFFQVAHALQISQQINAAQRLSAGAAGAGAGDAGPGLVSFLPVLSFRPWALECLLPGWSFRASSAALFVLAWAVGAAGVAVPAWRRSCVLLLDLMYLPVAQRAVQWFNTMRLPREDDNVRLRGARRMSTGADAGRLLRSAYWSYHQRPHATVA